MSKASNNKVKIPISQKHFKKFLVSLQGGEGKIKIGVLASIEIEEDTSITVKWACLIEGDIFIEKISFQNLGSALDFINTSNQESAKNFVERAIKN